MSLIVSERAELDLDEIESHIGTHNPVAATQFMDRLAEAFERLMRNPRIGRARADLGPGLRTVTEGRYVIFYRIFSGNVEIVRVLHGMRNLPALLKP